jgi:hypothetical protein
MDPRAFEIVAACGFDSGCAITGDARTAMPMAVSTTFKLVFIIGLICFVAPAAYVATMLRCTKTSVCHENVRGRYPVYVDFMRLSTTSTRRYLPLGILLNRARIFALHCDLLIRFRAVSFARLQRDACDRF